MKTIRQIYRFFKKVPLLGSTVKWFREKYQSSFIYRKKLRKRDIARAKSVAYELFGLEGEKLVNEMLVGPIFKKGWSYGHSGDFDILMLYAIVRATKPRVVVETGVASGRSSAAILSALKVNGSGTLYSIDLPQHYTTAPETYITHEGNNELSAFVPEGEQPGWLVPDELRSHWELILGDAKKELVKLLERIDQIDVFYHDSDHSEEHMTFEFESVLPKLGQKGFILSDDVSWNQSWKKFVNKENLDQVCVYRNMGIAKRNL